MLFRSQFYKLAIKANNETAERFQDWVTEEVLPSIRKTGSYGVRELTQDEIVGKAFGVLLGTFRINFSDQRMLSLK